MTCTNYTRCARTALRATTARAHEKEISFAETVSAQAAPGEAPSETAPPPAPPEVTQPPAEAGATAHIDQAETATWISRWP